MTTTVAPPPQRQAPLWKLAITSFVPPAKRPEAAVWIGRLPLALLVLLQVWLSMRLSNTAFEDEALYALTGHAYLGNWFAGQPLQQDYGDYLSGVPVLYPVVAGALDLVGGLWLVRVFSLLLMVGAMLSLRATARHLWGSRCGNLVALAFVLVGPVMFVGWLATFDAACVAALSAAIWLGVTRRSYSSAASVGLLLALAALLKYTGVAFAPIVLVLMVATAHRRIARAALAGAVSATTLASLYLLFGSSVRQGIVFTTTDRAALFPMPRSELLFYTAVDLGPILVLALLGAYLLLRSGSVRTWLVVAALLAGAALLPAAQLHLGEGASFEKHLAYSALFLAPLAGRGLISMTSRNLGIVLVVTALWIAGATGLARSHAMYEWANVGRVAELIKANPTPGVYLSTASELEYYTHRMPQVEWESQYAFFDSGRAQMRAAVKDGRLEFVALRDGPIGNKGRDESVAFMIKTLDHSPNYRLAAKPFPIRPYSTDTWRVYRLVSPGKGEGR
jgi:hypothetical protein